MERDRTKAPPKRRYRRPDNQTAIRPGQPVSRGPGDRKKRPEPPPAQGLDARVMAVDILEHVLARGKTLDEALGATQSGARQRELDVRDRGLARLLATTVLRHRGRLSAVVGKFLERPLPREAFRANLILLSAAAQLLLLGTPGHAAIYLAVAQAQRDPKAERYQKLVNAVLRKVDAQGPAILKTLDGVTNDVPAWLLARWSRTYGADDARKIAEASLEEAALDVTLKDSREAALWAERLKGAPLPQGSIRLGEHAPIEELPGFAEGVWWVQDAAASLPARLLGDVTGKRVADLCAAPGGKTAQLASFGAQVFAVDHSAVRLKRLEANMQRLGLADRVTTVQADILDWKPAEPFDAVLLDAPCSATGTIRRHPDLMHLKGEADIARLAKLQARLLAAAAAMVAPGGTLLYCTCSLEPEEGEQQIAQFLSENPAFTRRPVMAAGVGGVADWVTPVGDLRTLPFHLPMEAPYKSGMDGFYAARLVRAA
ncbi:MAG TPA: RsmB/NOP family class I SAM-dependent RNA methyltransferase [Hyphomicrobiaceae bacterium]|nr:RsmB/NOP family class I SAM-dependent RNA methyltransferase [Hyphomicrobiaceae bacterium]